MDTVNNVNVDITREGVDAMMERCGIAKMTTPWLTLQSLLDKVEDLEALAVHLHNKNLKY